MEQAPLHAAGDGEDLTGDVSREVGRGEEDDGPGDVVRLGDSLERAGLQDTHHGRRVGQSLLGHRRARPAGADRIDASPGNQPHDLVLQGPGEAVRDRGLGRRVGRMPLLAEDSRRRAHDDHRRPGRPPPGEVLEKATGTQKDRGLVGVQHALPSFQAHLVDRGVRGRPDAGVGDQDVDLAELLLGLVEQRIDLFLVSQVRLHGERFRVELSGQILDSTETRARVEDEPRPLRQGGNTARRGRGGHRRRHPGRRVAAANRL